MKIPVLRFPLLIAGIILCALSTVAPQAIATTAMQEYVNAMQPGTNLGNTLEATPNETNWGQPYTTQKIIQQLAAQGYKSIRIPVTWDPHMGPAPSHTIDAAWMDRVQQVVDWSLDAGLYVMINIHHDSYWIRKMPAEHDAVLARYKAIWTQIAARFKDHSSKLMFESINEPTFDGVNDTVRLSLLHELNLAFHKIVRGSGGGNATRALVLPTVETNSGQQYLDSLKATMNALNDSNLIATVHYYGWYPFSVNLGGSTRFDQTSIQDLKTSFDAVHSTFVNKGIPVVLGEFGLLTLDHVEEGERLKFFEYVVQYSRSRNITHMLWDCSFVYDRKTLQWADPKLAAIMKQAWTGRALSSETDLLFLKEGAPLRDAVISLNLNGNTLVSVKAGLSQLTAGTDYSLNGEVLTIKSSVLAAYANGAFGEKTTLTLSANSGPDWTIHVRYVSLPTQSVVLGSKGKALLVPTTFNGDVLATIKSTYTDGGNVGPTTWTEFQQWGEAFLPDYTNNKVKLNDTFFTTARAGTANFSFYFWSGRVLRYQFVIDASGAISGQPMPDYEDYYWAPFTVGVSGSWSLPSGANTLSATYSATGLPAWASIDPATGMISGTPTGPAGRVSQVTITVSLNGKVLGTTKVNLVVASPGNDLVPVNMSSRGRVGVGDQIMVSGFVVSGTTQRDFLMRAVGPSLGGPRFNLAGVLADPKLGVFDAAGTRILNNDQWDEAGTQSKLSEVFATSGAFSLDPGSRDAAMLATLSPGLYTAQASGVGDKTGVALVELYDLTGGAAGSSLVNISSRAYVGTGDDVLVAGIVFKGGGTKRILLRAVGPTLERYSVQGVLAAPQITLVKDGVILATNDSWCIGSDADEITSTMISVGAFGLPAGSHDAALLVTLPEGAYTMTVRGGGNTTGVALAEVYVVR